ncbi:PepSY-associated TM helix domain-containing protein [Campylobacter gastrosuis]|uniref:PepSY domain-containing protein n=1 Tax=Campylobacter gastrosuis TaxID=2974576 RepID=A0ABT7HLS8_9BACT|nr:PepSY-associated TM helix domain-containing protein [Campylobacter gastrosuis]MDL0087922.1 PepSY domain-containing protein [Campylobacter gastrosuis]
MFKKNRLVFNLHLLLTFLAFLPLFIMSISGSIVAYRAEIKEIINQNLFSVEVGENKQKISEILTNLKAKNGDFEIRNIDINKDGVYHIYTQGVGGRNAYFANPYNGEIYDDVGFKAMFVALMFHRNLGLSLLENKTASTIGKHIVAISSISLALLILSGIWLYLPLIKKNFTKSLMFKIALKGRAFWYQLHASLGLWTAILLLIMSLSGLFWSYGFVRDAINTAFGVKTEQRAVKNAKSSVNFSDFDRAVLALNADFDKATISSNAKNLSYKKGGENFSFLVENNATLTPLNKAENIGKMDARAVSRLMLSIHQGDIFGEVGRVMFCLSCLLINLFIISGFVMLFKRINPKSALKK